VGKIARLNWYAMTKVQLTFKFSRALGEPELVAISRMHSVYGFLAVRLKPATDELFVEYDASRLSAKEVRAALEQHGIPLAPAEPPRGQRTDALLAG
jgi:hypothetical protein